MTAAPGQAEHTRDITVLYDGQCPLCRREMAMIKRRDKHDRIGTVDIADPDFDPQRFGITHDEAMGRIHAQLPDGRVITGVEVFRRLYKVIGLGWLLAWTRLPGLRQAADWGYRVFARNRHRITGRSQACDRCVVSDTQ